MANKRTLLNGWQQLWLVAVVCLALVYMVWQPMWIANEAMEETPPKPREIGGDFLDPACADYQTQPVSMLRKPDYAQDCWYLYSAREHDLTGTVPYTWEVFWRHRNAIWQDAWLKSFGNGTIVTVILCLLLYFLGWVVAP